MTEKLVYVGKAKQVWETADPNQYRVVYLDQATQLNGKLMEHFDGKGAAAHAISTLIFNYLAKQGIQTHLIKRLSPTEDLVQRCRMIPLEFVTRNRVAGHFATRFGLTEGQKLAKPVEETFYKSDKLDDPLVNGSTAEALGFATAAELATCWALCREINAALTPLFARAGIELVDFKLEFGRQSADNQLVLADEFSPDNCRLWDSQTKHHLDKDVYRRNLADLTTTYDEVLNRLQTAIKEA